MMSLAMACAVITFQEQKIKAVDGLTFQDGKYEYRLTYRGGFGEYVAIDKREVGRRNFYYCKGVSAVHCSNAEDVIKLVVEAIKGRGNK